MLTRDQRLLDRQVALLDYLTSSEAIFGGDGSAPIERGLGGLDVGRLRLEAKFSYEKRIRKITAVFAKSWQYLEDSQTELLRGFVDACPPESIGRVDNAKQFYDFLCEKWACEPPEPAYLPDIAAYELAYAKVRNHAAETEPEYNSERPAVRRHRRVELLMCGYDIRSILTDDVVSAEPGIGEIFLAIIPADNSENPRVLELPGPVFDLLGTLERWTVVAEPGSDPETWVIFCNLENIGLLEVAS